jgi:NIPSNAP
MKRRSFIKTSLAAFGGSAVAAAASGAERSGREFYELRAYTLPAGKQPILDRYLSEAFIPAIKRTRSGPVGVFHEDTGKVYVLIVHPATEHVTALADRLAADPAYQRSAAEYLSAPATDPVYTRIESSLLAPIEGMPHLVRPDTSRPRLLNLRVYESHNERAARKKIEMFNQGELAIFRRDGLTPVFFGATVAGAAMPNLTYMLVFPDDANRAASWARFGKDPEWQKLKATPGYADKEIVSHITNKLLRPTACSEI